MPKNKGSGRKKWKDPDDAPELTRAFLNRIEQLDATLQSYITVLSERAISEARHAEAEMLRGEYRGPVHRRCCYGARG